MYRDAPPGTLVFHRLPCLESTTYRQQEKRVNIRHTQQHARRIRPNQRLTLRPYLACKSFASDDVKRGPTVRATRGKRTAAFPVDIAQRWLDEQIGVTTPASVDLPSCQQERKSADRGTHHVSQNTTECSERRAGDNPEGTNRIRAAKLALYHMRVLKIACRR